MKKLLFAAILFVSAPAIAEEAAVPETPAAALTNQDSTRPKLTFEERKTKLLERIAEHIAALQKKQACIQAAETPEETMRTCFRTLENIARWRKERKTKLLEHVAEHIAALQKKQACIQAAETPETIRTCFQTLKTPPDGETVM